MVELSSSNEQAKEAGPCLMKRFVLLLLCLLITLDISFPHSRSSTQSSVTQPAITAITGVTLIDGSGRAPLKDSVVVVVGDSITAVGPRGRTQVPAGARVIDGSGLVLAPGFIDTHNHSDRGLDDEPTATTQVSQGITTIAVGQDGGSALPVGEYLSKLEHNPVSLNVLTFVGHASLRTRVMGENTNRTATDDEISKMKQLVEQAMRDGAFGLSTGLEYETGKPATTEEVIALASVAGQYGGIYISHIRDEADKAFDAFAEALRIGREGHLPAQISHIKLGTVGVWGRSRDVVAMIEKARKQGQDVTADCYPYDAWNSTIRVLIPSGRHDNVDDVTRGIADVGGPSNITIVSCRPHPDFEFKTLADIARLLSVDATHAYMQIVKDGGASIVCHSMKDDDIRTFYQQRWVMVSSDGGVGSRHPRGAGTFPRVLGRFVRELHWLALPEAIRKMTSLPAWRLGLKDRGLIKPGYKADFVLFDPATVLDRATFEKPQLTSAGIRQVFVNGVEVWDGTQVTGNKPGRPLRHAYATSRISL
ncbi:MAG: aminoacylase [Blastocatellia bacterium]|nr:MAG: aminoacylase [Blastocatellia bacterium]